MLNQGIQTTELSLLPWVLDPDASDKTIVDSMRLPRNLSIEALLVDETAAVERYHARWTLNSGLDTSELFLRNSVCKRALYLSAPIFLPDNIPVETFVPTGVNSRVHVYNAADVNDTVRLEAISSFAPGEFRFRYALSIQYAADSVGLGWQVIRPVIILDRRLVEAARRAGKPAADDLERVLGLLRQFVLLGSHDYVHATVLNWFPPLRNLAPAYAAITSERVHPAELEQWHAGSQQSLPPGFAAGRPTPDIATLELYSLLAHAETIARMWEEDPRIRSHVCGLVSSFSGALGALLGHGLFDDGAVAREAGEFFMTLACWFLVSALPLGSKRLAQVLEAAPDDGAARACQRLASVHGGMFDFVRFVDPGEFPWRGRRVPVHEVAAEYAEALRWPAVRDYLQYLLRSRPAGDGASWAQTLCAPLADAEQARLLAALADLRTCADRPECERGRAGLLAPGQLDQLRAISHAGGGPGPPEHASARCARAIVASFVSVADAIGGQRPGARPPYAVTAPGAG